MSGLVLKLSPKERILINGAVLENGDRRSRISILTPNANILRLRDAIHPTDADTPVKRACYALQLVLTGDSNPDEVELTLLRHIEDLSQVFIDADSRKQLTLATQSVLGARHYQALKALRALIAREERLLAARRA